MRAFTILGLGLLVASPALAQDANDPDHAVGGSGHLPAGWQARTDKGTSLDNVKFAAMGSGYHITLGPRTIFWRSADKANGSYRVEATLSQTTAPSHPEAYGLFIGGRDLEGADQQYVYFVIRGDGKFLIKRREGATTVNVSPGWSADEAIKAQDTNGAATNAMAIEVTEGEVRFLVNDAAVYTAPAAGMGTDGMAGLRVNHNLDLHIAGFSITQN